MLLNHILKAGGFRTNKVARKACHRFVSPAKGGQMNKENRAGRLPAAPRRDYKDSATAEHQRGRPCRLSPTKQSG